jgi:RNA-binding protein 25
MLQQAKARVDELVTEINQLSQEAANSGLLDKEKYVIPPHLHDLQEADLPETQRGLVISEIAQFRERAAKREREKMRDVRDSMPQLAPTPSGPKVREWGKPQTPSSPQGHPGKPGGGGRGKDMGYNKPVGFVKAEDGAAALGSSGDDRSMPGKSTKTDEELEKDRKENRRREEEVSFRDVSCL